MKDKVMQFIEIKVKELDIEIGCLKIKSLDGSIAEMRIFFDGKEVNFIERMHIEIDGSHFKPQIAIKIDPLIYERYKEGEKK